MAKFKVEVNDIGNVRDILQHAYMLADEQLIQAQNEINKMASATQLQDESMDSKAKYGKIISDYLSIKDKAISKKMEIAKLLTEILNHNGNITQGENGMGASKSLDLTKIKELVKNMHDETEKTKTIELKNKK